MMTTHLVNETVRDDLSDRVDTIGWGLLLLVIGAVSLVPTPPDGAWLVAAGLVMLGSSIVRRWLQLAVHGVTVVLGIVALAGGFLIAAGLTTEVVPLVLIVLGVTLMADALYRSAPRTADTPRSNPK